MPHASELRTRWSASARTLRAYEYIGDTRMLFIHVSDTDAMNSLVDHFRHLGIQYPLTRESFEKIGGKSFTCDERPVFIPAVV